MANDHTSLDIHSTKPMRKGIKSYIKAWKQAVRIPEIQLHAQSWRFEDWYQ